MSGFVFGLKVFSVNMMLLFSFVLFDANPEKYFWAADVGKIMLFGTGVFFGKHVVGGDNG